MKQNKVHRTNLISFVIVIVTMACIVFLGLCLYKQASLEVRFDAIISWMARLDKAIANLDTKWEILICIFALYLAKTQLPIPISFICVISGMVYSLPTALIINVAFSLVFFMIKYTEGKIIGGGWAMMILNLRSAKFVKNWVLFKGSGNPYILGVSRLIPTIPLGMVSKLYGSMNYDVVYYICLSICGIFPRMFLYTKLGTALYNPFSKEFITWMLIAVVFTGLSSLIFNIFYGRKARQMNQTILIYSQKQKYKIVL